MNDITPIAAANALHPETEKLVAEFSDALRAKLAEAAQKYGFNDDWRTDDWRADCQRDLTSHVAKGDPLDVAAYAAFCWARGWKTSGEPTTAQQLSGDEILDEISNKLSLESWFEGKTLTVMIDGRFAKLRLVNTKDKPTAADLRGEPE